MPLASVHPAIPESIAISDHHGISETAASNCPDQMVSSTRLSFRPFTQSPPFFPLAPEVSMMTRSKTAKVNFLHSVILNPPQEERDTSLELTKHDDMPCDGREAPIFPSSDEPGFAFLMFRGVQSTNDAILASLPDFFFWFELREMKHYKTLDHVVRKTWPPIWFFSVL